ncbi:DUF6011 domain-containing protein [Micromonospora aurantiaca (nom. illeg.)]|uniref:DUF6011 domain-containing protein n=1 Tax=Micromonospora aurantiaca (nom. illeg.) TaxID=47850 RepID=UPI003F4A352E
MGEPKNCSECGRRLRTAASRARGMGPVCEAKTRPPQPAPATLPGLSGQRGPAGQDGPDLLDTDDEDGPQ